MPKFPEPPEAEQLAQVGPVLHMLPQGVLLWRVYFRASGHPVSWYEFRRYGPVRTARFDHHLEPSRVQERGILYLAKSVPTCIAEVFQAGREIDRYTREPWLVGFELTRDVTLLDLRGAWPTRAGASMAISSGPRPRAQRWSRTIYEAYPQVEGLLYPSSMYANEPSVALYERAEDALPTTPAFIRPLADPVLLRPLKRIAWEVGYDLR